MPWIIIILATLLVSGFFIIIFSLISYYASKWLAKWLKGVKRIDNRNDLDRLNPGEKGWKLKEIVRIVRTVSHTYQIKMPEVGVYVSNEVNAFATGPAGNTLIAFSSNLVNTMNIEEIRGVVGHEISHILHNDIARILLVQGVFDAIYWVFSILLLFAITPRKPMENWTFGDYVSYIFRMIFFQIVCALFRLMGILLILWYNRKRELAADIRGAQIVGVDNMLATLKKLLELENRHWTVDGIDLTEDERMPQGEPNSLSALKFNPEKKKRGILDWFRTHPRLEERIARLEKFKKEQGSTGII